MSEFQEFPKMARLSHECVITEKIDGTNAQVQIVAASDCGDVLTQQPVAVDLARGWFMFAGSRNRYITPDADNYGFAAWVKANNEALWELGLGRHYGEWWGAGIQRRYGLAEKRFSLFNVARWADRHMGELTYIGDGPVGPVPAEGQSFAPACCHVVPVLYRGEFSTEVIGTQLERLKAMGSVASPGFMQPEGVVCYHVAAKLYFEKTIEKGSEPKSRQRVA